MASNATTQFLVCRAAVRRMLVQEPDGRGGRGALLLMSSTLATHPSPAFFATHGYAATKGAIESLTRAMAAHYAPDGIRVNAIAPSLIATPMSRRAQDDPGILGYLARKQPLAGGPIDADAVTAMALHLLSSDARDGHRPGRRGRWRMGRVRGGDGPRRRRAPPARRTQSCRRLAPIGRFSRCARTLVGVPCARDTAGTASQPHLFGACMRQVRPSIVLLAAVIAALLALPSAVLAVDGITVTGSVIRDGAPVTGVGVVVSVTGSDLIVSTATDENGAFAVAVEAGVGSELQVFATGSTSQSDPDRNGCVTFETPIGQLTAIIEQVPPPALTVALDTVLESTVCGATGTPGVTPPSTDAGEPRPAGAIGGGLLLVLGLLALVGAAPLSVRPTRH